MSLAPGVRLGGYDILAPLGAGGMGEVYRAHDDVLDRDVAIKILSTDSQHDTGAIERFFREARAASALNHPNIITIHGAGHVNAGHFIVMELVHGRTLRELMRLPVALDVIRDVGAQIARALATAHAAGIVHRDIKPENIMVRDDGYVKVLDFGLARLERVGSDTEPTGTITQRVIGTPRYISPERVRGEAGGPATDIFSLGVLLYELAAGRHPFHAGSSYEVVLAIVGDQPVPPSRWNVELPRDLDALMLQMLDKDPARRPTASDVERALRAQLRPAVTRAAERIPGSNRVGRERERTALRTAFDEVAAGHSLMICVAGEPGIGKSTLVEDFILDQEQAGLPCHIARGRCSERLAGTEAYLPLLDALENLVRGPDNSALARLLKNVAPLWHAQIAPSTSIVGSKTKPIGTGGSRSQERLKRELVAFVEEATRAQPLVLFLDDVHWADVSTVDLLSYLASRCSAIPLLVVVTFRPEELLRENHPFLRVKQDLQARGSCRELRLEFLTAAEVAAYLEVEFPDHRLPSRFVKLIHDKTEGNPLFMVDVLRYLRDRGVLAKAKGRWTLNQTVPDIARALPESVRGMIERKIDGLEDADRRLLLTASVQGYEFDGVVVARLLRLDPADVEERLAGLERIHGFVRTVGEVEYPDRTLTLRYRFVHVLYQNLLYSTLTPSRRVALSKAVGDALEAFYRDKAAEIVSELAVLFEAAREFSRAAEYFQLAAKKAAGVFAYEEALVLGRRALGMLRALPDTPQRRRRELDVLMVMGVPATATRGYASREVQEIYDRASALCVEFHETGQLALALWRLFAVNVVRLQLETAHEIADRLGHLPHDGRDSSLMVQGELALGLVAHYRGEFQVSADHCERAILLCTPDLRRSMCATLGYDPMVSSYDYLGHARACLGYPDAALQAVEVALQAAGELGHPYTLAHSLHLASVVCSWRGDWKKLGEYVERLLAVTAKEGFSYFSASAVCFDGIRLAREGRPDEALVRMQEGWEGLRAIEGGVSLRRFASDFADQLARAGRLEEGLDLLAAELATTGSARFWDAELVRVRGELLLMRGRASDIAEAERCFERALDIGRQQQAKSFELRAATSLARLWHAQGKSPEAAALLSASYGWFTEGFDTTDLTEARTVLAATKARIP